MNDAHTPCRIDQWLVAARFYKTRSLACDNIKNGRILINGQRPKPSRNLNLGDIVQINKGLGLHFEVEVLKLETTRPSAKIAATFYQETPQSLERREQEQLLRKSMREEAPKARPNSRERQKLRQIHRGDYS